MSSWSQYLKSLLTTQSEKFYTDNETQLFTCKNITFEWNTASTAALLSQNLNPLEENKGEKNKTKNHLKEWRWNTFVNSNLSTKNMSALLYE